MPQTLDLLVLGGTSWLGGAIARAGAVGGHRVTCLARGEAGSPPEGVSFVRADRAEPTAYDAVADRDWDAVLDVSWQPGFVRSALDRLSGRTAHWVYVSSGSVYRDDSTPGADETAPLHEPYIGDGPVGWADYGPAKVACEQACLDARGADGVLLARAGLVVGHGDRSDRFGYWPARLDRAGGDEPVLVPWLDAPLQVVDVEDLAGWLVAAAVRRAAGAVNAVGEETTVGAVLAECLRVTGAAEPSGRRPPRLVEVTDTWLEEQGVVPWSGEGSLPLWLPQHAYAGFMTRRDERAVEAGLTRRPLAESVRAALRWERELDPHRTRLAGLSPGR